MKLKQTKKKLLITLFLVVSFSIAGFSCHYFFKNTTNADSDTIEISYDTTLSTVRPLGVPGALDNNILKVPTDSLFDRLKSWSNVGDTRTTENSQIGSFSGSVWKDGRLKGPQVSGYDDGQGPQIMRPVKYLEIFPGEHDWTTQGEEISWTVTSGDYEVKVQILETYNSGSHYEPFLVGETHNYFSAQDVYADSCTIWKNNKAYYDNNGVETECNNQWMITNVQQLQSDIPDGFYQKYSTDPYGNQSHVFVKLKYTIVKSPDIYYLKIDDIDAAQSFRFPNIDICDTNDQISGQSGGSCNIFVNPADVAQFNTNTNTNNQDNYIYYDENYVTIFSSYKEGSEGVDKEVFANPDKANIYIKFGDSGIDATGDELGAGDNSVDVVYGFSSSALSRWEFFTESFDVTFNAVDQNGYNVANVLYFNNNRINESVTAEIYEGETIGDFPTVYNDDDPASTGDNPYDKYAIAYWTSDQDVTIGNVTIPAGQRIYPSSMSALAQSLSIKEDYTFTAHLTIRTYTVTWKNADGTVLETDSNVAYGTTPTYDGSIPTKTPTAQYVYTFSGWTPAISTVTGNQTYTATYTQSTRAYTVTWKNWNNTVLETDTNVAYGSTPQYNSATPTRAADGEYSYNFSGWTPTISTVTGDQTYIANYTSVKNAYLITFKNYDGTTLCSKNYEYGELPTYPPAGTECPTTPVKPSDSASTYEFVGWDKTIVPVTEATTYTAIYREIGREYTVKIYDEDRTTLRVAGIYEYDDVITNLPTFEKESTEQYNYEFNGFIPMDSNTPDLVIGTTRVTGDYNYYISFTPKLRKYTVQFVDDNGDIIDETEVEYGETPEFEGETPTKTDGNCTYTFASWSPEIEPVTGPATYKVVYGEKQCSEVPNTGFGSSSEDHASSGLTVFLIATAGVLGTISAVVAYRLYTRRKTLKF